MTELASTSEFQELMNAVTSGYVGYSTWAELAVVDRPNGSMAEVDTSDVGTHEDPLTLTQVNNSGRYRKQNVGWIRIGDEVSAIYAQADGKLAAMQVVEAAVEVDRLAAEAAANAASVSVDNLTAILPVYPDEITGRDAVLDGEQFLCTPAAGDLYPLWYRIDATEVRFMGWRAPNGNGQAMLTRLDAMRARANRPEYEWYFGNFYDAGFVVNTGIHGDIMPEPHPAQMLGGAWIVFDGDGGSNGERYVHVSGVSNDLNYEEVVEFQLGTATHNFEFIYRYDFDDAAQPTKNLQVYASLKKKSGTADNNIMLGVDSTAAATRTDIVTTDTYTLYKQDIGSYQAGVSLSCGIYPDVANSPTYPIDVDVQYAGVAPAGVEPPSLATLRNFYLSGHAMPALALGNASLSNGAFRPTLQVPNMTATLRADPVTGTWWTMYIDLDAAVNTQSDAFLMSYGYEDRNDSDLYTKGSVMVGGGDPAVSEYAGRLNIKLAEASNQGLTTPPDLQMWGAGLVRVDVFCAGDGFQSRQNSNQAFAGDARWGYWIDGCPESEYPAEGYTSTIIARLMYLAGKEINNAKAQGSYASRSVRSPVFLARYRDSQIDAPTYAEIHAEIDFDRDVLGIELTSVEFALGVLGDSTSRFSGNPHRWAAYNLQGENRRFSNLSQGGQFHSLDAQDPVTSQYFDNAAQIEMREDYFKGCAARGVKRGIYYSNGGENNPTHLTEGGPAAALADYAALAPAESAIHAPGIFVHAIATVRPSGLNGTAGRSDKDTYNAYLRSVFTTQVDGTNPYLWSDPNYDGTGFKYMIDVDAWAPRHPDHAESYANWDAALTSGGNAVISGDLQHWAGQDGGKYAAIDILEPSYKIIAVKEWGYVL